MASAQLSDLLRFLSKDAKIPLATAMGKIPELQKANMTNAETLAKTDIDTLNNICKDEKLAKQILNAAKRVSKKRGAPTDDTATSIHKRKKDVRVTKDSTPFEIESSLAMPVSSLKDDELQQKTVILNRAPLVLAFAVTVLKYTMPEQPISSRLSLAQAVVSANSRSKAVSIGLEKGQSAEEEGWGEGHPVIKVLGREIRVLKRWDYDPREGKPTTEVTNPDDHADSAGGFLGQVDVGNETEKLPPLWGVDLEALRSSHSKEIGSGPKSVSTLPIYTAESARSYLLRSISRPQDKQSSTKKSASSIETEREECVAYLLHAIDSVCRSWALTLQKDELDRRAWAWYLRVRPDVQSGAQGWGEKGHVKLADILTLRRDD